MSARRYGFRRCLLLIGLLLYGVVASAVAQPESAEDWLRWANDARTQHSFVGEFLYQHGEAIDTMRIWRSADGAGGVRERLLSLSGAPREILRGDATVTCIFPGNGSVMTDRRRLRAPLSARLPEDIDALQPHYAVELLGEDRVAGRPTMRVGINAQDKLRYGYELWFDKQTGILLRAELHSAVGEVVERLMMLDLELRESIPAEQLSSQLPQAGFQRLSVAETLSETDVQPPEGWRIGALPKGFGLRMNQLQRLPGRPHPVRHMMFSDGLATVSVYIEPESQAESMDGSLQMGAMNAYVRTLSGYQAVAIGEVPAPTVRQMADSLVPTHTSEQAGN